MRTLLLFCLALLTGVPADAADTLRIGRGTDCKLHLPDPRIALHHAAIYRAEDGKIEGAGPDFAIQPGCPLRHGWRNLDRRL